ncbi:homeobox-leucine zipper protein HOX2 isoform X4 [Sorghum bicolor]|uniref:homeobox-leucine zipper protein HOX2 isoform X4 n=1 Tax=Sorghum bicolor TaxID=4558 RepID=UPI0007F2B729|nr:homeobox-leucine zipper protein HOX2 isoform X4 [Sorghum bicolor]|eukprot:XP_021305904.1 homeobox-leucine zipper protein HOX2 isoform X4 [Sorghum bicolor]
MGARTSGFVCGVTRLVGLSFECRLLGRSAGVGSDHASTRFTSPDSVAALSSRDNQALDRSTRGDKDGADGAGGRNKLWFSKDQATVIEVCFKMHSTLKPALQKQG